MAWWGALIGPLAGVAFGMLLRRLLDRWIDWRSYSDPPKRGWWR